MKAAHRFPSPKTKVEAGRPARIRAKPKAGLSRPRLVGRRVAVRPTRSTQRCSVSLRVNHRTPDLRGVRRSTTGRQKPGGGKPPPSAAQGIKRGGILRSRTGSGKGQKPTAFPERSFHAPQRAGNGPISVPNRPGARATPFGLPGSLEPPQRAAASVPVQVPFSPASGRAS